MAWCIRNSCHKVVRPIRNITLRLGDDCVMQSWILHHDDAPAYTSMIVREFLHKNRIVIMPQPPFPPTLAGVVHHEFFPQGRTANKEYYLEVRRRLCDAIMDFVPAWWRTCIHIDDCTWVFGQKQNRNHALTTVFTGLGLRWIFSSFQNWRQRWKESVLLRLRR